MLLRWGKLRKRERPFFVSPPSLPTFHTRALLFCLSCLLCLCFWFPVTLQFPSSWLFTQRISLFLHSPFFFSFPPFLSRFLKEGTRSSTFRQFIFRTELAPPQSAFLRSRASGNVGHARPRFANLRCIMSAM